MYFSLKVIRSASPERTIMASPLGNQACMSVPVTAVNVTIWSTTWLFCTTIVQSDSRPGLVSSTGYNAYGTKPLNGMGVRWKLRLRMSEEVLLLDLGLEARPAHGHRVVGGGGQGTA